MGLQENYAYDDPRTIPLQTEEVCSLDLNGDGQDEEIQFYIEQPGSDTDLHFIINGTDYAIQHAELGRRQNDTDYFLLPL